MGGNMDNLLVYISLGILVCCQTSWGKSKWEQNPSADRFNFFDTELFEMLNRNEDGNVIISPLSIKTMLGMIMEGAENESEKQIRTALRLSNDRKIARKEFSKWMHSLTSAPSNVILKIANKLFLSHKFSIQQEYRSALENDYLGDVTKVKFEEPVETAKLINDYINNQTGGLIPSLVDETQLDAKTELLLTNAIYFKGNWMNPFPKDRTIVKCFYPIGDECKKTNMMTDSGWYKYAYINQLDAQAIELPYQDKKFSMVILLPNKRNGIKQLTRDIIHIPIGSIFSELREKEVYLQLPRFSAEYKNDLSESLKSLQITDIFSQKANLTRILTDKNETLFVSKILHAAKIIVNEEGSEAAAATGAIFVPLMGSLRVAFTADHPFLFFIRDTTTNTTLFAGKVSQPEEASQDVTNTPQEGPVRVSINQKPYESAHQIFYQEIFTPSPPISNGVQKENSYVMRKPGRLPPPPSPTGLPNGFLSQNVGSKLNITNDKSSYPENSIKPISTVPPSLFRPTTSPTTILNPVPTINPIPTSTNVKRNIRNQNKFVFYAPIYRKLVPPENLAMQEDVYQSYFKKISLYERFHPEPDFQKSKKSIKAGDMYADDFPIRNKYDSSIDRISFLS